MQEEGIEDGRRLRTDSTAVETDIHYPTNNSLIWDCIKTSHRLLKKLEETGRLRRCGIIGSRGRGTSLRSTIRKKKEKRGEIF